jgi:hypothetical protein
MSRPLAIAAMLLAIGCGHSSPRAAAPAVAGACPEAYFAVSEAAQNVQIFQVTPDCTVTLRNTIEGATGDVGWPNARADLVLYESLHPEPPARDPSVLRQMVIASPLTTRTVEDTWEDITFGESDPEGAIGWGVISDDQHAYAIGCADWEQGEEEWHCSSIDYLRSDGEHTDTTPVPLFARAIAAGPIADGVELVAKTLACKSGDELVELTSIMGKVVATSPWYGDRYFLYEEIPASRTSPESGFMVTAMQGCHRDGSARGWFLPGPGGLVAHALVEGDEVSPTRILLRGSTEPLTTADGKPFETADDLVWAAP